MSGRLNVPATLIKWDALSLQPVKMFTIGGRLHHLQIFQDKYMLVDTFSRDDDGLDVFLLDPQTDKVIGGVRDEDLGGQSYTAFTDDEFIYILMQPHGYGPMSLSGYVAANLVNYGKATALRPFWVTKIDPDTWEVVQEYPYPGYRGDWICFDTDKKNMFIPSAATSNVSKVNLSTGEIVWTNPTGIGPYGCNVSADGSQLWVADKGEANGFFGRTVTVLKTDTGQGVDTIPSGYMIDHVLLSPNGKEFWATSNAEGKLYVFDAAKRDLIKKIEIPGGGDAHGLPWVYYDQSGKSMVARDQGGFRNGINPRLGKGLDY
ncbi:YncE family protein [Kineobactrum salinum]|uniref:YncE family protein n=1 Tax=Kineobactrum salinum TaxID=2708301 RepID=A0A6C0TYS4_9GAMM|nr:YncE family protein [Kineobactrum salinum]QIB64982.1 YncE family protein [Kineobactrum salinum]